MKYMTIQEETINAKGTKNILLNKKYFFKDIIKENDSCDNPGSESKKGVRTRKSLMSFFSAV